jgi:predicted SprT family Zn-dependent metalloprotease
VKTTNGESEHQQIVVSDRVSLRYQQHEWCGTVVRKGRTHAHVVIADGREFRVPYQQLVKISEAVSLPVRTLNETRRAELAVGERVHFDVRGVTTYGVVARLNPKRAHIITDDGSEYHTPYSLLRTVAENQESTTITRGAEYLDVIVRLARNLLVQHQLQHWSFQFDDGRKRAGCCRYDTRVISISYEFAKHVPDEEIRDTLLHEIAHALVGKAHNHDEVWRTQALAVGCSGRRCHDIQFTTPRYIVKCERGCWVTTAERRRHGVICKHCRGQIMYLLYTDERWRNEQVRPPV